MCPDSITSNTPCLTLEEHKEARKQKIKAIWEMEAIENKQEKAELKVLVEEEKEVRAERKQQGVYCKQRADTVEAGATSMGILLEKMVQLRENAEAVKKHNDKMYTENAKENRRKKAEAAH